MKTSEKYRSMEVKDGSLGGYRRRHSTAGARGPFRGALIAAAALVGLCLPDNAEASLILVDGTAPGYVKDGSFEAGSDGFPIDWLGNDTSSALANDLDIDQAIIYRTSPATPSDGSQYTVVGANGTAQVFGVYVDTGYSLALGDTFNLSFYHGAHSSVEGGETFQWQLFTTTTDDDSGTVEDTIASGTLSSNNSTTLILESLTGIGSVTGASVGERLFLAFTPDTIQASDYIALDQVNLQVITVPEPSTLWLVGLSAVGLLLRRRRRK